MRLNFRYYHDSDELSSEAYGIKFKHYFSARLSAHIGYRYYDQSDGADFNSFSGGLSMLL